ncbi:hypothetical protein AB1K84_22715 [Mesobacillus foraminis]|uniref:YtzH-like protein n=1 Tax=Mesobacillus foraminis TaxID=279826 RepID=A0A4R2BFY2_9BACI|nr:hypothetical protein [Mesobacillus foraminis]TCN25405.1 hypothetical protein EV146_10561 [Mesobacillus foraminis]
MSYYEHPDKQGLFQAAQQGMKQATDVYTGMDPSSPEYGSQLSNLMQEVNEAIQQIQTAISYASDHQRMQLGQYLDILQSILTDVNKLN